MTDNIISTLIKIIREEQKIPSFESDDNIKTLIKEVCYELDQLGKIDYEKELDVIRYIKDYVLYARYNQLPEFRILNAGLYAKIQREHF